MTMPGVRSMPPLDGAMNGHAPPGLSTPLPTANRPKGYAALAVMLIVGLGALGYWFYGRAAAKVPVLVAAREVPAGHVITPADVTAVDVAGGVTAVAADHEAEVVGHPAAVTILPRTPVQLAMVGSGPSVPASQALVGVAEAPGQVPSAGLSPGDVVEVLRLPDKSAGLSSVSSPVLATATVFDVRPNPSVEGGMLLTLAAPRAAAYPITAASDDGLVALVKVGGQP